MRNPLKQGLKQEDYVRGTSANADVAMRNPLKQGLKLQHLISLCRRP